MSLLKRYAVRCEVCRQARTGYWDDARAARRAARREGYKRVDGAGLNIHGKIDACAVCARQIARLAGGA